MKSQTRQISNLGHSSTGEALLWNPDINNKDTKADAPHLNTFHAWSSWLTLFPVRSTQVGILAHGRFWRESIWHQRTFKGPRRWTVRIRHQSVWAEYSCTLCWTMTSKLLEYTQGEDKTGQDKGHLGPVAKKSKIFALNHSVLVIWRKDIAQQFYLLSLRNALRSRHLQPVAICTFGFKVLVSNFKVAAFVPRWTTLSVVTLSQIIEKRRNTSDVILCFIWGCVSDSCFTWSLTTFVHTNSHAHATSLQQLLHRSSSYPVIGAPACHHGNPAGQAQRGQKSLFWLVDRS